MKFAARFSNDQIPDQTRDTTCCAQHLVLLAGAECEASVQRKCIFSPGGGERPRRRGLVGRHDRVIGAALQTVLSPNRAARRPQKPLQRHIKLTSTDGAFVTKANS